MSRGKTGLAALAALALLAAATPSMACTPKAFPEEDYPPNAPGEEEISKAYFDADEAGDNAAAEAAAQRWLDFNLKQLGEGNWFVGTIYFNLGFAQGAQKKDAQALANFTKARDIFARTLGADHARTRQAGLMLSVAQFKLGRYAEARATIKAVSQTADAVACPDSDAALAALKTWAQTAGNGEVVATEAAWAWGELAARRLRRFGPTDAEVPQYEIEQGAKLLTADRPAEALPVFVRAATRLEAMGPTKTLTALNARTWEAEALLALGRFPEAEERIKAVMTAARRADPKAGETIDAEDLYLRVLMARADYGNAPKVAEDLLKSRIAAYGEDNPRTLSAADLAASLYETLGQVAAAERLRRILLDADVRKYGPDSDEALRRAYRLADLIADDDRAAEAEAFLKPTWQRIESRPATETTINLGNSMGLILRAQERSADAESLFRRLQRRSIDALGANSPTTLNVTNNLAIVLNDTGRSREAEALHREVWAARKAALGPAHPDTLASALNVARTMNAPERFQERVAILFEAQEAFEGKVSAAHPTVIAIMNTLVDDLQRAGRADGAEMLLTDMRKVYMQIYGPEHPRTRSATLRLARAMGRQDKHAAAEPLFAELVAIETRRAAPGLPPTGDMIAASTGLGLSRTMQGRAREGYPSILSASQAVYERSRDNRTVGAGAEESRRMLIENRYVFNALLRAGWAYAHEP